MRTDERAGGGSSEGSLRRRLDRAEAYADVLEAIYRVPPDERRALALRVIGPMQASVAALPDSDAGTRVLDLSGTHGMVGQAHTLRGAEVDLADHDHVRTTVAQLLSAAKRYAHITSHRLPYPDSSFDVVHLDADSWPQLSDPAGLGDNGLLREVRRVLAVPGGVLVLTASNPRDPRGLLHGRLRHLDRATRLKEISRYAARLLKRSWAGALQHLGFHHVRPLIIWGDRFDRHLLGDSTAIRQRLLSDPRGLPRSRRLRTTWRHVLATTTGMAPTHCIVAGTRREPMLASWRGEGQRSQILFDVRFGGVIAHGQGSVVKAALTPWQGIALREERTRTEMARDGALSRFVPRMSGVEHRGGLSLMTLERAAGPCPPEQLSARMCEVLESSPQRWRSLSETRSWDVMNGCRWPRSFPITAEVVRRALRPLRSLAVPCGASHGDLWPENLLLREDGTSMLVDWDNYDEEAPLVVDAITAWFHLEAGAVTDVTALDDLLAGRLNGELGGEVNAMRGDLTHAQAALVHIAAWVGQHGRVAPGLLWPDYVSELARHLRSCIMAVEQEG